MELKNIANTKFKDSFFTKLFSEPETILKLYNAVSGNGYPLDTPIQITTLADVFYKGRYNDLSFIIDGKLVVLIEHQSSVNPNMPIRLLLYLAKVYDRLIQKNVYSSRLIKIPKPEFIVLYNGTETCPDESVLKLSDAFYEIPAEHKPNGSLELTAKVLNINKGHNEAVVRESTELGGYVDIVDEIRKNKESGLSLDEAVEKAVRECAGRNILSGFLERYGGEVLDMLYAEWNLEEYAAAQRYEGLLEGLLEGKLTTARKALKRGLKPIEVAEITDLPITEVEALGSD
ncbi:MAG: Rpn family recombination-promoting nuclease/putative transposase [Oscillospiraceae bacterium]|jgi:predicted transposase/invertase (TIGR01784 family)|nr:Rpn family recombination-promoting nuclease/putative transposase [Oscillospiraceae bacterium]